MNRLGYVDVWLGERCSRLRVIRCQSRSAAPLQSQQNTANIGAASIRSHSGPEAAGFRLHEFLVQRARQSAEVFA